MHAHHNEFIRYLHGREDDRIIVTFGEIDVREHIVRKSQEECITVAELCEATAESFVKYIASLRETYDISVLCVVPPGDADNPKWFKGEYLRRKHATELLNARYRYWCDKLSVPFIDIYDKLVDKHGHRRSDLVIDMTHLGSITHTIDGVIE
ncbi:MAG: SGNH/GDSL hydrolase family protein [Gammaproteobacteria bacterium]|nr:SGNH/GDSL hydrolase family protein [Gammaproteobacteria bacterium]